jgi:ribosomal protein S18 acetylase RimI-like enzyme
MQIEKTNKVTKPEIAFLTELTLKGIAPYVNSKLLKYVKTKSLSSKLNNFLLLRDGEKIGGFIMYRVEKSKIFIYELHVCEELQSAGNGKKLLEELFKLEEGKKFILNVHGENAGAIKLYKSAGFEESGKTEKNIIEMTRN